MAISYPYNSAMLHGFHPCKHHSEKEHISARRLMFIYMGIVHVHIINIYMYVLHIIVILQLCDCTIYTV